MVGVNENAIFPYCSGSVRELLGIGIWEYEIDSDSLHWSREIYEIYGIDENVRVPLQTAFDLISELDRSRVRRAFELCMSRGKPFDLTAQIFNQEQFHWVRCKGKAISHEGSVVKIFGTLQDVSQEMDEKERIRKQEDFFQGILAQTQGWVWEVDQDMNVIHTTPMIEDILGFTPEEVIGKSIYSFMTFEDAQKLKNESTLMIESRLPFYNTCFWCLTKSNKEILIRANAIPVYNIRGEYSGYKGIVEDITSDYILEERSKHKEIILREMKIGKWEYDSMSDQLVWNQAMYDLLEIDRTIEPQFLSFINLVHPDDRKSVLDMYQSAHANLTSIKVIHRLVYPGDRERWVRSEVRSFKNFDGSIRTIGYMQDVSEIRNLESELIAQKSYLESIITSLEASSIVSITDTKGKILNVNDQFCKVSGYSRDELLGNTHKLVNSGYHSKEFMRELWDTILNGKRWRREICNKTKNGEAYWVDTIINPIFDSEGNIHQFLSIRNLITKQKDLESMLTRQNDELESERKELTNILQLINKQIDFAESLQRYLLPESTFCKANQIKIEILNKPIDKVSGDIYDFFPISDTKCRFFIADATGHGLTAGFQTMFIQTEYQRIKDEYENPGSIIDSLNQSIWKTFPHNPIHYTCCVIDVDWSRNKIIYANAAHPEPILQLGNTCVKLETTSSIMGLVKNKSAVTREIPISKPLRMFLYTDGITETHNESMEFFDLDGLIEFIRFHKSSDPQVFVSFLEKELNDFRGEKEIFDDMTLLVADFY